MLLHSFNISATVVYLDLIVHKNKHVAMYSVLCEYEALCALF